MISAMYRDHKRKKLSALTKHEIIKEYFWDYNQNHKTTGMEICLVILFEQYGLTKEDVHENYPQYLL